MHLINKIKLIPVFVVVLVIVDNGWILGQETMAIKKEQPRVLRAVAPTFIPFVFNETGVAEVVVEVKINNEGKVISAKTISFSLFKDLSFEHTAKQWIFEESVIKEERTAHIKFVLRIMPMETNLSELTTIYRYPAEIEIRSPVFAPQITTAPISETEKPKKEKSKP